MSADVGALARAYGAFCETLTPGTIEDLRGLASADV